MSDDVTKRTGPPPVPAGPGTTPPPVPADSVVAETPAEIRQRHKRERAEAHVGMPLWGKITSVCTGMAAMLGVLAYVGPWVTELAIGDWIRATKENTAAVTALTTLAKESIETYEKDSVTEQAEHLKTLSYIREVHNEVRARHGEYMPPPVSGSGFGFGVGSASREPAMSRPRRPNRREAIEQVAQKADEHAKPIVEQIAMASPKPRPKKRSAKMQSALQVLK